jgi:hypothetical protein
MRYKPLPRLDYLGFLGVIPAREVHREDALHFSQRLEAIKRPYLFGYPTLWRAKIAVCLRERERAVELLREAISQGLMPLDPAQGLGYAMLLHREIDFESMHDYPPFGSCCGQKDRYHAGCGGGRVSASQEQTAAENAATTDPSL